MPHLASKLPYQGTAIDPFRTRAEIDGMLHEFQIVDEETKAVVAKVVAVRWTDVPPEMPILEFMVDYVNPRGVRKQVAIRMQPPLLYRRVRRAGMGMVNEPQPGPSMRLLYWYLQNKLNAVLYGLVEFSKEFLSEVMVTLPDGRQGTVGEIIVPQIQESRIPALTFRPEKEAP